MMVRIEGEVERGEADHYSNNNNIQSCVEINSNNSDNSDNSSLPSLIVAASEFQSQIDLLSPADKNIFFSLYDCHTPGNPTAEGIFRTNAFPMGVKGSGLFPKIARINHSCNPNVHLAWNPNIHKKAVFASRDIKEGEEILTTYIQLFYDRATRDMLLQTKFFFTCKCLGCTQDQFEASDIRRKKLSIITNLLTKCDRGDYDNTIKLAESAISLLLEEKLDLPWFEYRFSGSAFRACVVHGKLKEAKEWAKRTYDAIVVAEGENSMYAKKMQKSVQNPTKHKDWNVAKRRIKN